MTPRAVTPLTADRESSGWDEAYWCSAHQTAHTARDLMREHNAARSSPAPDEGLDDGPWQQRSDAATPGPWVRLDTGSEGCSIVSTAGHQHRVARLTSGPLDVCQANAEFIVMAVNYVRSRLSPPVDRDAPR